MSPGDLPKMKICSFVGAAGSALFTMPFQHTYILCDTEFGSATGGLYGIGMKVDTSPPHRVQAVTKLLDPEGTVGNLDCWVLLIK